MIKYLLPILFTVLTATHRDLMPSVLLFHLDQSANDLKIFNSNQQLVDNDMLNQILLKKSNQIGELSLKKRVWRALEDWL